MDFTLKIYKSLLESIYDSCYEFQTFEDFIKKPSEKAIVLRHDVDERPYNALKMAELEASRGIKATYYFRIVKISNNPTIIKKIVDLGHEIGYHYEDLTLKNGDYEAAINHFETQLERFRQIYPVKTICMHGSPLSKYDNRELWKYYDYRNYGIIAEPYFDLDFNEALYLTDTGRSWNNSAVSVRDKVVTKFDYNFKSTQDIIANIDSLPDKIMINTHSHRWLNFGFGWLQELFLQNFKNQVKKIIVLRNA